MKEKQQRGSSLDSSFEEKTVRCNQLFFFFFFFLAFSQSSPFL